MICRIASLDKSTCFRVSPPVAAYPSLNTRGTTRSTPPRQLLLRGDLIGFLRIPFLGLGARDALYHGGRGGETRSRTLLRRQCAHFTQRQCGLCIGIQRRVAAGENQAQAVIFDVFRFISLRRSDVAGRLLIQRIKAPTPPQLVGGLEAPSRNQPRTRILRHAIGGLLLESRAKDACSASSARSQPPSSRISEASTRLDSVR